MWRSVRAMTSTGPLLLIGPVETGSAVAASALQRHGWQLTCIDAPVAAADWVERSGTPPDLIVLCDRPEAPADAFLQRFASRYPIIVVTAGDDPGETARRLAAGAMDVLPPFDESAASLPGRVQTALHHWSAARAHRATVAGLLDERQRLSDLLESIRGATWEWDVATGATRFSESWAGLLGYTLAELAPVSIATWRRLAHPADLAESDRRLGRHFAGESPHYDYECRMRHRAGHWIWIHDRGHLVSRGPDGAPALMVGIHTDITARKETETRLRESLLKHQTVVQTAMDGFCIVDAAGQFREVNDAFCSLTGYSALELLQLRLPDLEARATPATVAEQLDRIRHQGSDQFEAGLRRRDGASVEIEARVRFLPQLGGVFVFFVRDCSERKRIAAHLLRRKQELKEAQELARIGSWRTILRSTGDEWIASDELRDLLAWPPHEFLPVECIRTRIAPAEQADFASRWREVQDTSGIVSWVHRVVDAGPVKWVQLRARAIRDPRSGAVTEITGTLQDITGPTETAQQLELHAARLRRAEKVAGIGYFEFSFTTTALTLSEGARSILGIVPANPTVIDLLALLNAAERTRWQHALRTLVETGEPVDLQLLIQSPSAPHHTVVQVTAEYDPAGRSVFGVINDLTERHDLLNELREKTYYLEKSQELAHIGSYKFDIQHDRWTASDNLDAIFGITPDHPRGAADWINLVAPSHRADLARYLQEEVLGRRARFDRHYPIQRVADQRVRWLHGMGELELDEHGRPLFLIGTIQDITEQRQAEEALRLSEERFRTILQSVHFVAVQGYAPDGTTQYWNRASENLYGYTADEALGRNLCDLIIPPEDVAVVRAAMQQMATSGIPLPAGELSLRRKDGSRVPVFSSHAIIQQPGRPQELFCVDVDLTALRRAENRLQLQATALDASANAIVITDRDGTIEWANAAFTAVTGYAIGEAIGHNPRDLVRSDRQDVTFYETMWSTITAGEVWRGELVNRRKDGTHYTEEMTITPIHDEAGEVVRFVAVKQDITERKALETQLRHAQKMDAIGRLAGGVAHDFNNILAAVLLHLGLLLEEPSLDEETKASLRDLTGEIKRGAALTRQLLTFSRKEAMQCRPVEVRELVQSLVKMVRRLLPEDVAIRLELDPVLPSLHADPGMIEQVLLNLCINARDAMPHGGTLTLRATTRRIDRPQLGRPDLPGGLYLELRVIDTGEGIKAELLQRIFEPFFTTKDIGRGTGLGLSTAYGIIHQHAGWLEVESTVGVGSDFRIYLPVPTQPPAPASAAGNAPASPPDGQGECILLVEDEAGLRRSLTKALERHNYRVLPAADGQAATALWQAHAAEIALLITDLIMPNGVSGTALIEHCRRDHPELPVIACSGYRTSALPETSRLRGLQKPFDSTMLLRTVRELLDPA